MDFILDTSAVGNRIRTLKAIDGIYPREGLAFVLGTPTVESRVTRVFDGTGIERELTEEIPTDKGPEFTSKAMYIRADIKGTTQRFLELGTHHKTDVPKASTAGCAMNALTSTGF